MERLIFCAPILGICALLFAFYLTKKVGRQDAGTDRMKEIAAFITKEQEPFSQQNIRFLLYSLRYYLY